MRRTTASCSTGGTARVRGFTVAKLAPGKRVHKLLDALKADFPRRKAAIEAWMKDRYGLDESVDLRLIPPEDADTIPTFARTKRYSATPMLKARFEYASTVDYGGEIWLGIGEMRRWMRKKDVRAYHTAMREDWEGSAPMLFRDDQLTLLEVSNGVPDCLTYLVWARESKEPEIWRYRGMESHRFKDLEAYLTWL